MFDKTPSLSLRSSGKGLVRHAHLPRAAFVLMAWLVLSMNLLRISSAHAATAAITTISSPSLSGLTTEEVSFSGGNGIMLHGTILELATAKPGRPGVVLVHGSGSGLLRTKLLPEATAFAQQGLSVLIYDKRSVGLGDSHFFSLLANDALGAVHTLRAHPGVDPAKVGIWGFSEGGWVAPLAASRSVTLAFVIVVGANAMVPLQQQTWEVADALHREDVSGSLINRAEPNMYRLVANAGAYPEAYYNAKAVLRQVRQPLLGIWGSDDLSTPNGENSLLFASALRQGGNTHYTFRFFPNADHAVHQTPDGGVTRLPSLALGYAELVDSWVQAVTSGQLPQADAPVPPQQDWLSVPVPPLSWWESAWMQLTAFLLLLTAFVGYPLVALLRLLRGRSARAPLGNSARLLASAGAGTVLSFFVYILSLLLSNGTGMAAGLVLAGRPLLWLLLQALALTTVGASIATIVSWSRVGRVNRGEWLRLVLLLAGGALFVPWALYWGLLLP